MTEYLPRRRPAHCPCGWVSQFPCKNGIVWRLASPLYRCCWAAIKRPWLFLVLYLY